MSNSLAHTTQGTTLTQAEYEGTSGTHIVSIEHHTASDTLTKEETLSFHTNLGATASVSLALPQDAATGCLFSFSVMASFGLIIDPGAAGGIYINGAKQGDDAHIWADAIGESITLVNDGNGDWASLFMSGTWGVVS